MFNSKKYVHYLEKLKTQEKSCKKSTSCNKIREFQPSKLLIDQQNCIMHWEWKWFSVGEAVQIQESRQVPLTLICIPHPPQNTSPTI